MGTIERDGFGFIPHAMSLRASREFPARSISDRATMLTAWAALTDAERLNLLGALVLGSMRLPGEDALSPFDLSLAATVPSEVGKTLAPLLKWTGMLTAAAATTVTAYMTDSPLIMATTRPGYCIGARVTGKLRVRAMTNLLATDLALTVQANGSNSTTTVTIPGGSTSVVSDVAHTASFGATDQLDIVMSNTGGGLGAVAMVTATLEVVG